MNCLIVDDDKTCRLIVKDFISKTEGLNLSEECENALDAYTVLKNGNIDLVFLDIKMPKMTGMDLVEILKEQLPQIIFITSTKDYAIEAFDYGLTDYILKPITYKRFLSSVEKAKNNLNNNILDSKSPNDIYVKTNNKIVRLKFQTIMHIEACADYVLIYVENNQQKYMVYSTMKGMEKKLPNNFIRIHRSFIVNTDKIQSIKDMSVVINQQVLPVGASYKKDFLKKLNYLK